MNRFRRADRLRKSRDFVRVMDGGQFHRHPLLTLAVMARPEGGRRMGLSVGKKVGRATVRNQVKRRLRECYRVRLARITAEVDLIFFARPGAAEAPRQDLEQAMDQLLRRAKLWR